MRVPERGLLGKRDVRRDLERGSALGVERVQDRAWDLGSLRGGGVFQAHRVEHLFAQEPVQRFPADFTQDLA